MNAALADAVAAPSAVLQAPATPVAISAEMTAALLLGTAGAIALFWFSVKMAAGFREYRQAKAEREAEEAEAEQAEAEQATETAEADADAEGESNDPSDADQSA